MMMWDVLELSSEFQPSPSSTEDDLLSFPLIVINHIWKNSHDRSADWWQNTRSHLLSKCCQGQVDSRGRSWRVLVSPLSPSIIATPAHDSLRVWAGKIILPIIHIDLMAAAAKWNAFSPAPYKPQGSDTKWSYFLFLELQERFEQNKDEEGQEGWTLAEIHRIQLRVVENWEEKHSHNCRHPHFPFPINHNQVIVHNEPQL